MNVAAYYSIHSFFLNWQHCRLASLRILAMIQTEVWQTAHPGRLSDVIRLDDCANHPGHRARIGKSGASVTACTLPGFPRHSLEHRFALLGVEFLRVRPCFTCDGWLWLDMHRICSLTNQPDYSAKKMQYFVYSDILEPQGGWKLRYFFVYWDILKPQGRWKRRESFRAPPVTICGGVEDAWQVDEGLVLVKGRRRRGAGRADLSPHHRRHPTKGSRPH